MTNYVFCYGTLTNQKILKKLLNKDVKLTKAILINYAKYQDQTPWLLLKERKESFVEGMVFSVDNKDLMKLDAWEDVPLYQRHILPVKLENGKYIKANVYLKEPVEKTKLTNNIVSKINIDQVIKNIPDYQEDIVDIIFKNEYCYNLPIAKNKKMTSDEKIILKNLNKIKNEKYYKCLKVDIKFNNYCYSCYHCFSNINDTSVLITSIIINLSINENELIKFISKLNNWYTKNNLKLMTNNKPFIYGTSKINSCSSFKYICNENDNPNWIQRLKSYIKNYF